MARESRRQSGTGWKVKFLMLGDSGVGKSSLMLRFTQDTFLDNMMGTTGLDMREKIVSVNDEFGKVQVWDTAGQERFHVLSRSYYRDAQGIVLVYDVSEPETLSNIHYWINDIKENTEKVQIIILGNKNDLEPAVDLKEAQRIAESYGIPHMITSAKDSFNVQKAFETLLEMTFEKRVPNNKPNVLRQVSSKKSKKCC